MNHLPLSTDMMNVLISAAMNALMIALNSTIRMNVLVIPSVTNV